MTVDPGSRSDRNTWRPPAPLVGSAVRDVGESGLLARVLPFFPSQSPLLEVPNGDDAAVLRTDNSVVATTDSMVRGVDWRDDWSTPQQVGAKAVAQNLGDVASMGAVGTGFLVTVLMDPATPMDFVEGFAEGFGRAAAQAGVPVIGGDLGSMPDGLVVVSVTALGSLEGRTPVLRSGARPGHTLAVAGSLGRSGAGLELLSRGTPELAPELVAYHCAPTPPYGAGPAAAEAGASAMMDVSDGLGRDAERIARASGVGIELDETALRGFVEALAPLDETTAWSCVLTGGEEHSMLAAFPGDVPEGFTAIGCVIEGEGVWLNGERLHHAGWDHFGG